MKHPFAYPMICSLLALAGFTLASPEAKAQPKPYVAEQPAVAPQVVPPVLPGPLLRGAQVTNIYPYYPAWGRLDIGDVILECNNIPINNLTALNYAIAYSKGFANLRVRDIRTGQIMNVNLWLTGFPYKLGVNAQMVTIPGPSTPTPPFFKGTPGTPGSPGNPGPS